jgi:acyl-coenzyme A thioesterase PaaI-like protein
MATDPAESSAQPSESTATDTSAVEALAAMMRAAVPMVSTLDVQFLELEGDRAVLRLPDSAAYRNHIGGPHAGAMFTLGESASGALVMAHFGSLLGQVTPLAVEASIRYVKVAMGEVTATALLRGSVAEALATLDRGERPEFSVDVELSTGDGDERLVTAVMTVLWTLRPQR